MSTTDLVTALLPVADLHDSPFNERQRFDDATLASLAENIRHEGVLQPLLVRPCAPERLNGGPDAAARHEVVCGHRRLRAAVLAGLERVPCVVRPMTDLEARSAQVSENLQRENVHALEEAQALRAMMDEHGLGVPELMRRTGQTRSYIYARLKLLTLNGESRKAFLAGEMQIEIALVLARLPSEKLQLDALAKIRSNHIEGQLTDGGKAGYRRIKDFLRERYTTDLKGALWALDDAGLLPGAGACTECPKRSGQTPELFLDIVEQKPAHYGSGPAGANVCTDPDCYAEKKKLQLKREQQALEAKGQVVVAGGAARNAVSAQGEVKGAYIALKDVQAALKKLPKKGAAAAPVQAPQIVLIQDPRTGKTHKAVKRDELQAAGVRVAQPPLGQASSYRQQTARAVAEGAKRREAAARQQRINDAILERTLQAMADQPRTTQELYWVAATLFESADYDVCKNLAKRHGFVDSDTLAKALGQWPAERLALFAVECVLSDDAAVHEYSDRSHARLMTAAAHYGVDVESVRKGESTPTAAARASLASEKTRPKNHPRRVKGAAGVAGGGDVPTELATQAEA